MRLLTFSTNSSISSWWGRALGGTCDLCRLCRRQTIAPHVHALAKAYHGRARVGTCDVDANPATVQALEIRGMPTLLMFKAGQVVGQLVGAVPRAKIEALMAKALGREASNCSSRGPR